MKSELENSLESLNAVQTTIQNCDNKANSMLSAVGIIFGLSLFSVSEIIAKSCPIKLFILILGGIYLSVFIIIISLLVLIVFPRRRNKIETTRCIEYSRYSEDLYKHIDDKKLNEFVEKDINLEAVIDQIKNCARIAHLKENLLRIVTCFIIVFAILLVSILVLLFI